MGRDGWEPQSWPSFPFKERTTPMRYMGFLILLSRMFAEKCRKCDFNRAQHQNVGVELHSHHRAFRYTY